MVMVYEHVREAGPFIFIAGQTPQRASGEVPDGIEDQVAVAIGNVDGFQVSALIDPRFHIEIEAIAYRA